MTIAAVLAFFLIDVRGLTFFLLAWSNVPGFESIRAPFRVMTILYAIALFVLARSVELAWQGWRPLREVFWRRTVFAITAICLAGLVFIEMQRPLTAAWTRADLLPDELMAHVETARHSCDAVIVLDEDPDDLPWMNPINAVVFATVSGIPTPQGYSRGGGGDLANYPGVVGEGDGPALVEWMRNQGFDGRHCLVSSESVEVVAG